MVAALLAVQVVRRRVEEELLERPELHLHSLQPAERRNWQQVQRLPRDNVAARVEPEADAEAVGVDEVAELAQLRHRRTRAT